jgi:hypothetical protein
MPWVSDAGSDTLFGVQIPFRRKSADLDTDSVDGVEATDVDGSVTTVAGSRSRSYTPSKRELGQATPKRKQGGRKAVPPPTNRREASKRMREQQREARAEARAGMLAGDEKFLPAGDRGPERALVRDIVDSRRNLGSYVLFVLLFVLLGSVLRIPALVVYANMFFYVYILAVVVDSFLLTRRIKRLVPQRLPKSTTPPRSHYFYAIMRSLNIRRLRMPNPRVPIGSKI